jgi:hypothetical protein
LILLEIGLVGDAGRRLRREDPAPLPTEAVLAHLGAIAAGVGQAQFLAVGVIDVL